MRTQSMLALIFALCISGSLGARADTLQPNRLHWLPAYPAPAPERRGCYWIRQHEYCGRYCYVEVNGLRYCTERERTAHPQGIFGLPLDGGYPMKLGARPGRD